MGNRAATWTHGFQAMSRSASSVAQACVRRRGRTLVWPDGVQPIAPKAPPTPSARSPHECARDPPVGCASAAGLLLCVRSDGTVSHVAPPAPPRGVAPRPPGQGDGEVCRRSTRVSKGNDFSGKKRGINYFIRWKNFSGVRGSSEWSVSTSGYTNQYGTCRCATDCRAGTVWSGLPGQRRRALPAEVLRLSAPGWSAVCLAHCSSSE